MGLEHFGDFLGGLNSQLDVTRKQNREDAERAEGRENAIFTALANSDDPEVRAAAVTGLLTGKSPGKFFDRFMQKQSAHPAYEQIKGLVADGHQAFPGETEGKRREAEAGARGGFTGRIQGISAGAKEAGFTPDETKPLIRSALGGATRSNTVQRGTLMLADGSTVGGYFDTDSKQYVDDDGAVRHDVSKFSPSGSFGSAGANGGRTYSWDVGTIADTGQFPGEKAPNGWKIARDKAGNIVLHQPAADPPPSYSGIATNTGINVLNGRTGDITAPPTGAGLTQPTAPGTSAAALRAIQDGIIRMHPAPRGLLPNSPATPAQQQRWQQAVDAEAARYGYANFAALQAAIGSATDAVGNAVPGGAPPAAPAAPAAQGAAQGAAPATAAPTTGPPAAPGASPTPGRPARPTAPAQNAADPLGLLELLPR